jgi:hypothetical protein
MHRSASSGDAELTGRDVLVPGLQRGVRVVTEESVDAEGPEQGVFGEGVALLSRVGGVSEVERQERILVAEGVRHHVEAGAVRVLDEAGRREQAPAASRGTIWFLSGPTTSA